ncbi:MAG: divergent PAP2 family protein [Chloroflexi bacterium]|nr:divergent PAP2 family protein [Chloroflexota bacterium]
MRDLLANRIIISLVISWAIAQSSKVVIHLITQRRIDLRYVTGTGGMPSSHSSLVSSLATGVAIQDGLASTQFAIAAAFAVVVMFDAQGVRRAASLQAAILNQIIDELFQGHPISERRLRELLGHTPTQVIVGALIGIVVTIILMSSPGLLRT